MTEKQLDEPEQPRKPNKIEEQLGFQIDGLPNYNQAVIKNGKRVAAQEE